MLRFPSFARPPLRLMLGMLLLGSAGGGHAAQGKGLSDHNSDAPVDYAADRIEVQDKQDRVLLTGNVEITQADLRMRSARTLVAYTNDNGVKIQRIDSTGGVTVTRGEETAKGDLASYDFNRHIITMVGNVTLRNSSGFSHGERLVIDLDSHHSSFVSNGSGQTQPGGGQKGGGRVTGSFTIAKHTQTGQ